MVHAIQSFFGQHLWPTLLVIVSALTLIVTQGLPPVMAWLGLKKTTLETEKLNLEVKTLEEKRSTRLTVPTDADIAKYDPKAKLLLNKFLENGPILAWIVLIIGLGSLVISNVTSKPSLPIQ